MKTQQLYKVSICLLCSAAFLGSSVDSRAAEDISQSEAIQQAVKEAQEAAKGWAYRLQEWKSGEAKSTIYMGVVIESVPEVLRDYIDLPKGVGLLLSRITTDGPADKAGLIDNDILVNFDGQLIVNYSQLSTLINLKGAGATVPVKVLRKGKEMEFQVTLEQRVNKGSHHMVPAPPDIPGIPDVPDPDEVGVWMERVEEWIPGSVRIFIDQDEQAHVDLQALKEDLHDLQAKLKHVKVTQDEDGQGLVKEYGDMGARTTVVHIADKNINYACKDGKVALSSSDAGRHVMVWDAQGKLIYEGALPEDYASSLPDQAVKLINSLEESTNKLQLENEGQHIEIRLNKDDVEPVT